MKQAPTIEILDDGSQVVVEGVIWIHPDRLSGAPCFAKTRVPIQNLFDYLSAPTEIPARIAIKTRYATQPINPNRRSIPAPPLLNLLRSDSIVFKALGKAAD